MFVSRRSESTYNRLRNYPFEKLSFCVFDLETTGLSSEKHDIIEIGAVKVVGGREVDRLSVLVRSVEKVPKFITKLTGITTDMLLDEGVPYEIAFQMFSEFSYGSILVQHSSFSPFDINFIKKKYAPRYDLYYINTGVLFNRLYRLGRFNLRTVCDTLDINNDEAHRALSDAVATAEAFTKMIRKVEAEGIKNIFELENKYGETLKIK